MGSRKYRAPEVVQDRSGATGFSGVFSGRLFSQNLRAPSDSVFGRIWTGYAADIWALGCVLYSLVAGKLPFDGRDKTEQVYNILSEYTAAILIDCKGWNEKVIGLQTRSWRFRRGSSATQT